MPLYEFECRSCGQRFEKLVLGSSRALPACPVCEGQDVEKLYSVFGVGASGGRRGGSPAPVSFGGG